MRINIIFSFVCFLIFVTGCVSPLHRHYVIEIKNIGKKAIEDVNVSFKGFNSGGGIIGPGFSKSNLSVQEPVPETMMVQWRTKDGVSHKKEVKVKSKIPKGMVLGAIEFHIDNNGIIKVVPVCDDDPSFNAYDLPDLPEKK